MTYSYTLLADLIEDPPRFKSRASMKKHLALHVSDDTRNDGIVIDVGPSSYFFQTYEEACSFLDIEDEEG